MSETAPATIESPAIDPSDAKAVAELVASLKAKHGDDVYRLQPDDDLVFAIPANQDQFDRFILTAKSKEELKALRELSVDCIVYPDRAALLKLFKRYPGRVTTYGGQAAQISGVVEGAKAKKQ